MTNSLAMRKFLSLIVFIVSLSITAHADRVLIRPYCFYVPRDKTTLAPLEQLKAATYVKLLNVAAGSLETQKTLATKRTKDFALSEKEYLALYDDCQKFVKDKGQVLDLKATHADWPETLSRFYPISIENSDENLDPLNEKEAVLAFDQFDGEEDLQKADIHVKPEELASAINENKSKLKSILSLVDATHLSAIANALKSLPEQQYASMALTIAGVLATVWFGPAYIAGAVDLLYPLVYGALFGVPSKFGLSYWLVYYPGKVHAVNWAFNNTHLILSLAGTGIALLKSAYNLVGKKDVSKEKLADAINNLATAAPGAK